MEKIEVLSYRERTHGCHVHQAPELPHQGNDSRSEEAHLKAEWCRNVASSLMDFLAKGKKKARDFSRAKTD